jgi:hypothetical protein
MAFCSAALCWTVSPPLRGPAPSGSSAAHQRLVPEATDERLAQSLDGLGPLDTSRRLQVGGSRPGFLDGWRKPSGLQTKDLCRMMTRTSACSWDATSQAVGRRYETA